MNNNSLQHSFTRRQCFPIAGSLLLPAFVKTLKAETQPVFYGLDFSPYMDGQSPEQQTGPIPESQIRERLKVIAPYTIWVRTYGTGGGLERTGSIAHELGLKAAIGVWLGRSQEANESQLAAGIACARAGDADMLVVGSETLLRGDLKTEQLCGYLADARRAVPKGLPVTTSDGYAQIAGNPEVAENVDLFYYNDYPYWAGVSVEDAISRMDEHYSDLVDQAGDKQIWISEHGWPTGGETVGKAVASPENAAAYLTAFMKWSGEKGVKSFLFEAFDERWKSVREGERGANWGVWRSDGACKSGYARIVGGQL
jgi:exo-beta-1,3-glucanase (GH17 family)